MKQLFLLTLNVLPGKGHVAVFVFVFFFSPKDWDYSSKAKMNHAFKNFLS